MARTESDTPPDCVALRVGGLRNDRGMPTSAQITIRNARLEDLDVLARLNGDIQDLHHESRPDLFGPTRIDELRQFLSERLSDSILIVAEAPNGAIAGYLLAERQARDSTPFRPPLHFLYIHHIAVDSLYRRERVGESLVQHVFDIAKAERADATRLDSWVFNAGAHRFFEAQGFTPMNIIFERRAEETAM